MEELTRAMDRRFKDVEKSRKIIRSVLPRLDEFTYVVEIVTKGCMRGCLKIIKKLIITTVYFALRESLIFFPKSIQSIIIPQPSLTQLHNQKER